MFSKAHIYNKFWLIFILVLSFWECTSSSHISEKKPTHKQFGNTFALPQQKAPPNDIQSIRLYPEADPAAPPVISLNSTEKLILSFDLLETHSRQFKVTVSHRNRQWKESTINSSTYLDSFSDSYIKNSKTSYSQRPPYHHLQYKFPNENLKPAVSGNYLIEIFDPSNNKLLFSMPFFITEDTGHLQTEAKRFFVQRDDGRPIDQLFSTYHYPDFVEYPQFDLSMSFVQNRFWGRTRETNFLDTITPGQIRGYVDINKAFVGNYEFKYLDLRDFAVNGKQTLEYHPGVTPPKIILRRDIQNLDTNPNFPAVSANLGIPLDDRDSNYARVQFSLETDSSIPASSNIFVVGHFNNWMIKEENRMIYDSEDRMWKGHALIKQGEYAYKYIAVDKNRINDLALDQGFLSSEQEYLTFVYFKDPNKHFDRLLKVNHIFKR